MAAGEGPADLRRIAAAAARLPAKYAPLCLSFYGEPFRVADGAGVIGSDEGTELRVDFASGHVMSVDPRGELDTRFVNSSVDQLAAAIACYDEYAGLVRGADDEAASHLVQDLSRRLSVIDAAATAKPDAWWVMILEQAQDGLL